MKEEKNRRPFKKENDGYSKPTYEDDQKRGKIERPGPWPEPPPPRPIKDG